MKKSSIRSLSVSRGHIDSALRTGFDEKATRVAATLVGEVGGE